MLFTYRKATISITRGTAGFHGDQSPGGRDGTGGGCGLKPSTFKRHVRILYDVTDVLLHL